MKFGTGSTTELTQKYANFKVQMTYVRPHIYINKYPRFSIELPLIVSRSLRLLANKVFMIFKQKINKFNKMAS